MVKSVFSDDGWVELDGFARQGGTTARNARSLQSAGLLPRPVLRGRTGYYGPEHKRRLAAVLRLQSRGFSISAIGVLLESYERGEHLEDVLGLPPRPHSRPHHHDSSDPFDEFVGRRWPRVGVLSVVPSPLLVTGDEPVAS
ncbi:MAG: MerR family transcriptional regulator [Acidimicrobiales bacterium]